MQSSRTQQYYQVYDPEGLLCLFVNLSHKVWPICAFEGLIENSRGNAFESK
jgi:hypothetical protein